MHTLRSDLSVKRAVRLRRTNGVGNARRRAVMGAWIFATFTAVTASRSACAQTIDTSLKSRLTSVAATRTWVERRSARLPGDSRDLESTLSSPSDYLFMPLHHARLRVPLVRTGHAQASHTRNLLYAVVGGRPIPVGGAVKPDLGTLVALDDAALLSCSDASMASIELLFDPFGWNVFNPELSSLLEKVETRTREWRGTPRGQSWWPDRVTQTATGLSVREHTYLSPVDNDGSWLWYPVLTFLTCDGRGALVDVLQRVGPEINSPESR